MTKSQLLPKPAVDDSTDDVVGERENYHVGVLYVSIN